MISKASERTRDTSDSGYIDVLGGADPLAFAAEQPTIDADKPAIATDPARHAGVHTRDVRNVETSAALVCTVAQDLGGNAAPS